MKYISVPEAITPVRHDGKPFAERDEEGKSVSMGTFSLHRYLMSFIVDEATTPDRPNQKPELKLGSGQLGPARIAEIHLAFRDAKAGDVVALAEDTHKALRTCIDEKSWVGAGSFGSCFIAFNEAILTPVAKPDSAPLSAVS